jgi:hypothetical protein
LIHHSGSDDDLLKDPVGDNEHFLPMEGPASESIEPFSLGTTHDKHKFIRFFEIKIPWGSATYYDYIGQELRKDLTLPASVRKENMTKAGKHSYLVSATNPSGQRHTYHVLMYQDE